MNDTEFKEISEFVYLLADNSKKITLEGFYSNLDPKTKKDGSPVTQYDIKAEKIICDLYPKNFLTITYLQKKLVQKLQVLITHG